MDKKDKRNLIIASVATLCIIFFLMTRGSAASFGTLSLLVMAAYVAFGVTLIVKYSKRKKAAKEMRLERYGAKFSGTLKHTSGLPIAKGVMVEVLYCPDKFVFKKGSQEFIVAREKITSVDVVTGQHIKSQQMAGAASGKYIFGGTAGAVIGALAATSTYLAISYVSGGKDKSILLDTASSMTFASKAKKEFESTGSVPHRSVEL